MDRRNFLRSMVALPLVSGALGSFAILDPASRDPLDPFWIDYPTKTVWLNIDAKGHTIAELYSFLKDEWLREPIGPIPEVVMTENVCPNIEPLWECA